MRMQAILLILIVCLVGSTALKDKQAAFTSSGADANAIKLYVYSEFGTPCNGASCNGIPYQRLKTRVFLNDDNDAGIPNPQLINKRTCNSANGFDLSNSTTWSWDSSFPDGFVGTDTVIFGDPVVQPDTKLRIVNDKCGEDDSFVSLRPGHGGEDFTFIGDFLAKQDDSTLVVNYDQIGYNNSGTYITNGTMALAGSWAGLCQDDWTYINTTQLAGFDSWAIVVDKLKVKNNYLPVPMKAKLSIDDYNLYIPEPYFTRLMKDLGASADGFIPCTPQKNKAILLDVGDMTIQLDSTMYLDLSLAPTCKIRIKCQDHKKDYITLPFTVFSNNCLLLDYKTKRIAIADNVNPRFGSSTVFVSRRYH